MLFFFTFITFEICFKTYFDHFYEVCIAKLKLKTSKHLVFPYFSMFFSLKMLDFTILHLKTEIIILFIMTRILDKKVNFKLFWDDLDPKFLKFWYKKIFLIFKKKIQFFKKIHFPLNFSKIVIFVNFSFVGFGVELWSVQTQNALKTRETTWNYL